MIENPDQIRTIYNAVITFTLELDRDEAHIFLYMWNEGDWDGIKAEFPSFIFNGEVEN